LAQEGIEVAVLDLRWLSPLDEGALFRAVRASSGRVVVLHEANETGGFGGEVVARLAQSIFDDLTGPVQRVGLPDVRVAASPVLQQAVFPSVDRVKRAVHATMRSI
jgi:2-oxoisovalerate dehydrogenase E1 component